MDRAGFDHGSGIKENDMNLKPILGLALLSAKAIGSTSP